MAQSATGLDPSHTLPTTWRGEVNTYMVKDAVERIWVEDDYPERQFKFPIKISVFFYSYDSEHFLLMLIVGNIISLTSSYFERLLPLPPFPEEGICLIKFSGS